MREFLGSVRRSLVMSGDDLRAIRGSGLAEKIGSCLRKSRVGLLARARPALPAPAMKAPLVSKEEDVVREIRWRRGEMIGCGAYGRVYMGMDLDSGELLAIKQVSIAPGSKDKAQTHIRELEEEVKLLKNLSHPNIVRYLGTAREDETLNILLEFVPGGSISSLLGKFGSFTEEVIRKYTKQLLEGLEYLHSNGIIHRDIKGANILVDKNGRIKLADFGASKQVVELATVSGAKSMKGTPYWMAPEVILQTGHTFSADIWSVGCTAIEMATGKPPWSQQYQEEFAALFHIGTTKSHPPIPDHLSLEAKDFLSKCLQKEPNLRPSASDLLQHSFVIRECKKTHPIYRTCTLSPTELTHGKSNSPTFGHCRRLFKQSADLRNNDSVRCSTVYPQKLHSMENMRATNTSDDMCRLDDDFDEGPLFKGDQKLDLFTENFNLVSEPMDAWAFDESPQRGFCGTSEKEEKEFTFPCSQICDDDEEVTELKIKEFLDEKAAELKKLQSPLFKEFYRGFSTPASERIAVDNNGIASSSNLPPKSKSPNRTSKTSSTVVTDASGGSSPASFVSQRLFNNSATSNSVLKELPIPQVSEQQPDQNSPSAIFSERQKKWKEELDQELERERVMKRLAEGTGSKTSSPVDKGGSNRKRERLQQRALYPLENYRNFDYV